MRTVVRETQVRISGSNEITTTLTTNHLHQTSGGSVHKWWYSTDLLLKCASRQVVRLCGGGELPLGEVKSGWEHLNKVGKVTFTSGWKARPKVQHEKSHPKGLSYPWRKLEAEGFSPHIFQMTCPFVIPFFINPAFSVHANLLTLSQVFGFLCIFYVFSLYHWSTITWVTLCSLDSTLH